MKIYLISLSDDSAQDIQIYHQVSNRSIPQVFIDNSYKILKKHVNFIFGDMSRTMIGNDIWINFEKGLKYKRMRDESQVGFFEIGLVEEEDGDTLFRLLLYFKTEVSHFAKHDMMIWFELKEHPLDKFLENLASVFILDFFASLSNFPYWYCFALHM